MGAVGASCGERLAELGGSRWQIEVAVAAIYKLSPLTLLIVKNRDFEACAVVILDRRKAKWYARDGWGMDGVLARENMRERLRGKGEMSIFA